MSVSVARGTWEWGGVCYPLLTHLARVRRADPPGPLGHCGVFEGLLELRLPLGIPFHEMHVLLVLLRLGALPRPPLLGETHVPARVLGRH